MAHDAYQNHVTSPAAGFEAVVVDTDYDPRPKGIYVGGSGNIEFLDAGGNSVTFTNVQAGSILPIRPRRIVSGANTTATGLIALI